MDRVLKERLVGAAVLVAIGAWLIPWVLDGPERINMPEATTLELPAPAAEEPPMRTETIVLERRDSPVASAPEPAPRAATPPAVVPTAEPRSEPPPPAPVAAPVPSPPPRTAPAPEPAVVAVEPGETPWFVQLGAFGERANADRLAARVGTYGYKAGVSGFPAGAPTVYRVRIGPEPTRARAESVASALSAHGFVAQVVPE
jgi:DedD protein